MARASARTMLTLFTAMDAGCVLGCGETASDGRQSPLDATSDTADGAHCAPETYGVPTGCVTCDQALKVVRDDLNKVLAEAWDCSDSAACELLPHIAIGCFYECARPISTSASGKVSKAIKDAQYGGFCVCGAGEPPECFGTGPVGCVGGVCQFLPKDGG